jgi:hypothetical protein
MILFNEIVEIMALLVENVTAKNLANGTWIGTMSIRRDSLWCMIDHLECVLEKALHCIHVSLLAHHGINEVPIMINRTREGAPVPMHFSVYFIDMPAGACLSTSFSA